MNNDINTGDLEKELYRNTWLSVLKNKMEQLRDNKEDFGKRCNIVRQAYLEIADLVLNGARKGRLIDPYFFPWDKFWEISLPEFGVWQSIRYYGRMPLYPQYPVLNYFIDFVDPWQRVGIEVDGKMYHDEGKDLRRDEELLEIGWKIFRIPAAKTQFEYMGPDDEFRSFCESDQKQRLTKWLLETSDGIVRAIKTIFYERRTVQDYTTWFGLSEDLGNHFVDLCYQTLEQHRLIKYFELPDYPSGDGCWNPCNRMLEP